MRLKLIFSLIVVCAWNVSAQNSKQVIDKVVAQIGDNIILLSDIQQQKLQAIQAGVDANHNLECSILEELMYQDLLINQAKLDSLDVTDAQVDAEMENRIRVIENQIGGRQKMEEFYGKTITQIKNEFREVIKDRMLASEMERTITSEISVTPKEVQQFYNALPPDSIPFINAQLSFQQIVHYPEITKDDKKRAYDKLVDIRAQILSGKSFETQARINSMDPGSAAQGGKIEATRGMMVPQFEAAVFRLEKNGVSDVFETDYGYHIVKLIDRKGDDYVCAHILIIPEFTEESLIASATKMDSCYTELKNGTITWDEAVIKYSNDEATFRNKGIITNPITGEQTWDMEDLNQVDQQIYIITEAMSTGDISQANLYMNPFERKQGVRIVRLTDRKPPHKANLTDDYSLIKNATENDKKQKAVDTWISSKIENAYIKIDDDFKNCNFKNNWNR